MDSISDQYQPEVVYDNTNAPTFEPGGTMAFGINGEYYFYRLPAVRRFDFMWEVLLEGAWGYFLLVDSTRPETFYEARKTLRWMATYKPNTTGMVLANKQDLPGAFTAEELSLLFQQQVYPCVATDRALARALLAQMIALLPH